MYSDPSDLYSDLSDLSDLSDVCNLEGKQNQTKLLPTHELVQRMKHEGVDVQVHDAVEVHEGVCVQLDELVRSAAPEKGAIRAIRAAVMTKRVGYRAATSEEAISAAMISTSR